MRSLIESVSNRHLAVLLSTLAITACETQPLANSAEIVSAENYEGLQTVNVRRMDVGQIRPGTDFSAYSAVILNEPRIGYRRPDRSRQQFPLDEGQKAGFQSMVSRIFREEIGSMQSPAVVESAGPDVLELDVRIENVTATVPQTSVGGVGRAAIALRAVGEVTLILELRDSESRELLARAVDTRAVDGVALAADGGMVTRFEDVEKICRRWAAATREGLEAIIDPD